MGYKFLTISLGGILLLVTIIATACGGGNSLPRSPLSEVTFGEVTIEGDENGFVANAIREAMYRLGASYDPSANPLIGRVDWFMMDQQKEDARRVRLHVRLDDEKQDLAAIAEVYRLSEESRTSLIKDVAKKVAESMARQVMARTTLAASETK